MRRASKWIARQPLWRFALLMYILYALASAAGFYLAAWLPVGQAGRNFPITSTGGLSIPFLAIWAAIPTAGSGWRIRRQRRRQPQADMAR